MTNPTYELLDWAANVALVAEELKNNVWASTQPDDEIMTAQEALDAIPEYLETLREALTKLEEVYKASI
jgi:hypothetical protein